MRKHAKRFLGMLSVLFILATAAVLVGATVASAALPSPSFSLDYESSTAEKGSTGTDQGKDTAVKDFTKMHLGAKVGVKGSGWKLGWMPPTQPCDIAKDLSVGVVYTAGVPLSEGNFSFENKTKPNETKQLVLKVSKGAKSSKFSFSLQALSPVSVDLDKAVVTIDTSKTMKDTLTLALTPVKGAVDKNLKIAGVVFTPDAALDPTKLSLSWDGADKIQAEALDAAYIAKDVPVKAEVGFTFVGWDGQNWALSEDVNFKVTSGPGHPATVTVTATAGAGGAIAPSGAVSVAYGADQAFTITANAGQKIKDVKVNGASVGAVPTYTMKNVTADGSIEATFEPSGGGGGGSGGGGGCSAVHAGLAMLLAVPLLIRRKD